MITTEQILELAKEHLEEFSFDDGAECAWTDFAATKEQLIEFAQAVILIDGGGSEMTENNKVMELLDNTFNSKINDWVEEAMWDFKLDNGVFDREIVKKILRFGYYTAVYTLTEQ